MLSLWASLNAKRRALPSEIVRDHQVPIYAELLQIAANHPDFLALIPIMIHPSTKKKKHQRLTASTDGGHHLDWLVAL